MTAYRFNLLADLELSLRALSEALSTIMTSIHGLNRINKRADQEDSTIALSRTLTSTMATPRRPGSTNLMYQPSSFQNHYWLIIDSDAEPGRLSRTEIVQTKFAELKRASSCFKCGDQGHLAAHCHNATLCFICNRHGHQSSQCRAITSVELPESECYEILAMDSIKRLESALTKMKQEFALMEKKQSAMEMAMAGMDSQIHKSQSKVVEIKVARATQQSSAIREEKRCEAEIGIGIFNKDAESDGTNSAKTNTPQKSTHNKGKEPAGTNSATNTSQKSVPVNPVGQDAWISQVTRTKIKKIKSGSIELNLVTLSKEHRTVHFKRVATTGTEKEVMRS